jgi:protein kinase C substrate 80K-H
MGSLSPSPSHSCPIADANADAVAKHYQSQDEFACITNTAIKLSLSQINDNTCDCPDGSDEPGTAACAYIDRLSPEQPLPGSASGTTNTSHALPGFWCANEGHIGTYVPFAYVNDGVCDYDLCCDGTEEYGRKAGVKCENRCAQIGKDYRKQAAEKAAKLDRAGKKRATMLSEAQELRRRVEEKVATLKSEVTALDAKRDELQRKQDEVEREERGKLVRGEGAGGGKLGVLLGLAKTRVAELRDTLDAVVNQRNELRGKLEELETILRKFKEEYNPNFNDEGVKAAVKAFEDYAAREETDQKNHISDAEVRDVLAEDTETNGVNWKEFEGVSEGDDTQIRK